MDMKWDYLYSMSSQEGLGVMIPAAERVADYLLEQVATNPFLGRPPDRFEIGVALYEDFASPLGYELATNALETASAVDKPGMTTRIQDFGEAVLAHQGEAGVDTVLGHGSFMPDPQFDTYLNHPELLVEAVEALPDSDRVPGVVERATGLLLRHIEFEPFRDPHVTNSAPELLLRLARATQDPELVDMAIDARRTGRDYDYGSLYAWQLLEELDTQAAANNPEYRQALAESLIRFTRESLRTNILWARDINSKTALTDEETAEFVRAIQKGGDVPLLTAINAHTRSKEGKEVVILPGHAKDMKAFIDLATKHKTWNSHREQYLYDRAYRRLQRREAAKMIRKSFVHPNLYVAEDGDRGSTYVANQVYKRIKGSPAIEDPAVIDSVLNDSFRDWRGPGLKYRHLGKVVWSWWSVLLVHTETEDFSKLKPEVTSLKHELRDALPPTSVSRLLLNRALHMSGDPEALDDSAEALTAKQGFVLTRDLGDKVVPNVRAYTGLVFDAAARKPNHLLPGSFI